MEVSIPITPATSSRDQVKQTGCSYLAAMVGVALCVCGVAGCWSGPPSGQGSPRELLSKFRLAMITGDGKATAECYYQPSEAYIELANAEAEVTTTAIAMVARLRESYGREGVKTFWETSNPDGFAHSMSYLSPKEGWPKSIDIGGDSGAACVDLPYEPDGTVSVKLIKDGGTWYLTPKIDDKDTLEALAESCGKWTEAMQSVIEQVGLPGTTPVSLKEHLCRELGVWE